MTKNAIERLVRKLADHPNNARFSDLARICDWYFGRPRQTGSSHRVYRTPWVGDPRINIQNDRSRAKAYQVKQVILAIEKLERKNEEEE